MVDLCLKKSQISISQRMALGGLHYPPCFHQTHEISHHGAWPDKRSRGMHLEMPQMSERKGFNWGTLNFTGFASKKDRWSAIWIDIIWPLENLENANVHGTGKRVSPPTKALGTARRLPGTDRPNGIPMGFFGIHMILNIHRIPSAIWRHCHLVFITIFWHRLASHNISS